MSWHIYTQCLLQPNPWGMYHSIKLVLCIYVLWYYIYICNTIIHIYLYYIYIDRDTHMYIYIYIYILYIYNIHLFQNIYTTYVYTLYTLARPMLEYTTRSCSPVFPRSPGLPMSHPYDDWMMQEGTLPC